MEIKPLKTFQTTDYELSKFQGYVKEFISQISGNQFLIGQEFSVALTTSGKSIEHKLGRVPTGWIVTDTDANATIWRTGWSAETISFDASATVNAKIWVF